MNETNTTNSNGNNACSFQSKPKHRMGALQQLYYGIIPSDYLNIEDPNYPQEREKTRKLEAAFSALLDEEYQSPYFDMCNQCCLCQGMEVTQTFIDGFRVGMQVTLDGMGYKQS